MKTICNYCCLLLTLLGLSSCQSEDEKYFAFLDAAEHSPIIEVETPEGFSFDMDEDAFYEELNLHNSYEEDYHTFYDKQIGKETYKCRVHYDFEEGKLCSHGFWIETKRMNDTTTIVGTEDIANIVQYYKEKLKEEYKYKEFPNAIIGWHKHVWVKDNIVFEIQYREREDFLPIMVEFENKPITEKVKRRKYNMSITSQPHADVKNSLYDGSVKQVKEFLKNGYLRDPDSYESIEWSEVKEKNDGYYVRHKYRAKNGFGGYVVANQLFHLDFSGNVVDVKDLY